MKRLLYSMFVCLAATLVGCEKADILMDEPTTPSTGEKVTMTAHIQGSPNTRVELTPETTDDGKQKVKVNWKESGETFKIYGMSYEEGELYGRYLSTTFTQVSENRFEGTALENCNSLLAVYGNHTMENDVITYDLSQQDGTLNEDYVIMAAGLYDFDEDIHFEHKTAILKTTFTVDGVEVAANRINRIAMGYTYGDSNETITVIPKEGAEDIYIFLLRDSRSYAGKTLTFEVTVDGYGYEATLTIPEDKNIEAGKFHTATIKLHLADEGQLPAGKTIQAAIDNLYLTFYSQDVIFETSSTRTGGTLLAGGHNVYIKSEKASADMLKIYIYTAKEKMRFHADCSNMFLSTKDRDLPIVSITFPSKENMITTDVTSMKAMFKGCTTLTKITNFGNFNTDRVTDMSEMFMDCSLLLAIDFTGLSLANVVSMNGMFYGCSNLRTVNFTDVPTAMVEDMGFMFSGCSMLTSLDLSKFNTENVTTMGALFDGCIALNTLTLSNNFKTENVTTMEAMFSECSALTSLDLSSFDTAKVETMASMFDGCSALTSLDLSHFNTKNVTTVATMFQGCSKMGTLKFNKLLLPRIFNLDSELLIEDCIVDMFNGLGSDVTKSYVYINDVFYRAMLQYAITGVDLNKVVFPNPTS